LDPGQHSEEIKETSVQTKSYGNTEPDEAATIATHITTTKEA